MQYNVSSGSEFSACISKELKKYNYTSDYWILESHLVLLHHKQNALKRDVIGHYLYKSSNPYLNASQTADQLLVSSLYGYMEPRDIISGCKIPWPQAALLIDVHGNNRSVFWIRKDDVDFLGIRVKEGADFTQLFLGTKAISYTSCRNILDNGIRRTIESMCYSHFPHRKRGFRLSLLQHLLFKKSVREIP